LLHFHFGIHFVTHFSNKVKKMFQEADTDGDGVLSFIEFQEILKKADNQLKSLPSVRYSP
jgi:uncharacterized protein (DUF302 family)